MCGAREVVILHIPIFVCLFVSLGPEIIHTLRAPFWKRNASSVSGEISPSRCTAQSRYDIKRAYFTNASNVIVLRCSKLL
jgi:hypothetical protein